MSREVGKKTLSTIQNDVSSRLTGLVGQLVQKAKNELTNSCLLKPLRNVIEPQMWFNPAVIQFRLLSQLMDAYVSLKQRDTPFNVL